MADAAAGWAGLEFDVANESELRSRVHAGLSADSIAQLSESTNFLKRSMPWLIWSSLQAKEIRTWLPPQPPKSLPGTKAMWASSRRASDKLGASVILAPFGVVLPNSPETSGKT